MKIERKSLDASLCKKEEAFASTVLNKSEINIEKLEQDTETDDEVISEVHPDDAITEIWEKAGEIGMEPHLSIG